MSRVYLTKKEMESTAGKEFLSLVEEISKDGRVDLGEVKKLKKLCENHSSANIPGFIHLNTICNEALYDGVIDRREEQELAYEIRRVVPKAVRDKIAKKISNIEYPMTERQREYLRDLTGSEPGELTISEASKAIDKALSSDRRAPTRRQKMVLRFWNQTHKMSLTREQVSDWLDDWYDEDPRRLDVWEDYKSQHGDGGGQYSPNWVELGAGQRLMGLSQNTSGGRIQYADEPSHAKKMFFYFLLAAIAIFVLYGSF